MAVKDFAFVVVRLFGLWILFTCIRSSEIATLHMLANAFGGSPSERFNGFLVLFDLLLHIAIGLLLTWKPEVVVKRLHLKLDKFADLRISTTNLIFVSFSVAGMVFLVTGLKGLVHHATMLFAPASFFVAKSVEQESVVTSLFQTVAGLWLLCRFKGIVPALVRIAKAGRTLGTPTVEEKQQ